MKHAINSFMFKEYSFETVCRIAYNTGCSWVGLSECHKMETEKLQSTLRKYKLKIHCVYNCFINIDDLNQQTNIINEYFQWAADVGVYFSGIVLQSKKGATPQFIAKAVNQICLLAKLYNLTVLVEPLSREMTDFSCLTEVNIINEVNEMVQCDNFGWILDLCHFYNRNRINLLSDSFFKRVLILHLAGRCLENSDKRNYLCDDLLEYFISKMQSKGFNGWYEIEVLNAFDLEYEIDNVKKIENLLLHTRRAILIGEFAVHVFIAKKEFPEELIQLGGGIGIMLRLLNKKEFHPIIVSCSGDDLTGRLMNELADELTGGCIHSYSHGRTSTVYLYEEDNYINNVDIIPGQVEPGCMIQTLKDLPDEDFPVYIPIFPFYESLLEIASKKKCWKLICDFGYFQWRGNDSMLIDAFNRVPMGLFLALINGAGFNESKMNYIIDAARIKGFEYIVVTNEDKDVLLYSKIGKNIFPVGKNEFVCCTCGAGDSLVAGLIFGLCKNLSLEESLQLGIEYASDKITKYGI